MKKRNIYIIIAITLFIAYAIYYSWHSDNLLNKYGRYTIGTIEKIEGGGKGGLKLYVSFIYKNIEYKDDYIDGSGLINDTIIGKRLFIKIVPNNPDRAFDFNIDCQVPKYIMSAPYEGWSQEWMKVHFPDCAK